MASVVHVIVGLGNGGAEKTLMKVCALDEKNSHVVISLKGDGHHGPALRATGGHLHCMGLQWWNLLWVVHKMRRLRCLSEADVVTAWMPHAMLLIPAYIGKSGRPKVVVNLRASSYGRRYTNFFRKLVLVAWSVFFGKLVDLVITPGKATAQSHRFLAIEKEKFLVIHNGFSRSKAPSGQEQFSPGQSFFGNRFATLEVLQLGMFARWHPQKNHSGFLKSLFFLSQDGVDFRVLMAGVNVEWTNKKLARIIKHYGLEERVELLGDLNSIDWLCGLIDVHVVASAYGEAFPNVIAETMLQGVPNIATDIGDAATVIGSTGWLVERGRPRALYQALKEAKGAKADLRFKGESARKRISSLFPVAKMVGEYSDLYLNLGRRSNAFPEIFSRDSSDFGATTDSLPQKNSS